jgi:hypothetical protein
LLIDFDALSERSEVVAAVASILGRMRLCAVLAKVFRVSGVMLGPARSIASSFHRRGVGRRGRRDVSYTIHELS